MSVHGMTISSISKIKKMAWNTIARWLKVASDTAQRFNDKKLENFVIHELKADEIRTFIQNKKYVKGENCSLLQLGYFTYPSQGRHI